MAPLNEQRSVEDILAEVSQPVLRYLERDVGDPAIASDLQQESVFDVARGYTSFGGPVLESRPHIAE